MMLAQTLGVRRRLVPLLLAVTVAVAIAAAFVIDPTREGAGGVSAGSHAGPFTPKAQGNMSVDPGAAPELQLRDGSDRAESVTSTGTAPDESTGRMAEDEPAVGAPAPGGVGGVVAESPVGGGTVGLGLKVLQSGTMTVTYKRGRLNEGYAHVVAVTHGLGGYVVASSRSDAGGKLGARAATLTVRVPNERFDAAIERLSAGGKVAQLDVTSRDVTEEYVDSKSRLRHNQAVESRLLQLLGRAKSVSEALVIQDRLAAIQQEIEVEKGRINYLDKMTALATIELTLRERGAVAKPAADEGTDWGIGSALDDAAHRFVGNVNHAIVAVGGALPALLLLAAALVTGRAMLRRRAARTVPVLAADPSAGRAPAAPAAPAAAAADDVD